jgi:hypothetical protein
LLDQQIFSRAACIRDFCYCAGFQPPGATI